MCLLRAFKSLALLNALFGTAEKEVQEIRPAGGLGADIEVVYQTDIPWQVSNVIARNEVTWQSGWRGCYRGLSSPPGLLRLLPDGSQ